MARRAISLLLLCAACSPAPLPPAAGTLPDTQPPQAYLDCLKEEGQRTADIAMRDCRFILQRQMRSHNLATANIEDDATFRQWERIGRTSLGVVDGPSARTVAQPQQPPVSRSPSQPLPLPPPLAPDDDGPVVTDIKPLPKGELKF